MKRHGNSSPLSIDPGFQALLDAAPNAMIITTQDGIIQLVNHQTVHLFGYTREELIGRSIKLLSTGLKKDGSGFFAEVNANPVQLPQGRFILTTIHDITKQKLWQDRLQEEIRSKTQELSKSRNIYRTIASSIPGSVIVLFDKEYRYLLIEGDLMLRMGYDQQKLLHQKAIDVLPPPVFQGVKERIDRIFAGEYYMVETCVNELDVVTRYVPIRNDQGEISMAMVVVIDITELKKSQRALADLNASLEQKVKDRTEQLTEVNREMESFTYSVSHDLRAPLRIIDGFADIMLSEFDDKLGQEGMRTLKIIKSNARRMGQLIDDLLNFSRLGRKELVLTAVNMHAVVEEVIDEQRLLNKPAEIHLDPLPAVQCDKRLMRQVWSNLVSNALKYSSHRDLPVVHISAYQKEKEIIFSIKDNGVGFDMQYAGKLFGVFQRLHKHNEYEGTGVGLALVHKIITKHGGAIWAEAAVDKGANFYFSLPAKTIND